MSVSALPARNILRHYRNATDEAIEQGNRWYDAALEICREAATEYKIGLEQTVCALAHLSSRASWSKNVQAFSILMAGEPRPAWVLTRSWTLATSALAADDPWKTFGRRAPKTRSFAKAILGDENSVTVDVWTARVAGVDPNILRRAGAYDEIGNAFRRAGKRVGVNPRDLQAICWVEIRNRAA